MIEDTEAPAPAEETFTERLMALIDDTDRPEVRDALAGARERLVEAYETLTARGYERPSSTD